MSPRGRALSFLLIALFEAQMRLAPGQAAARNDLPLKAENDCAGWTDYIATDAQDATEGRIFISVRTEESTSDPVELDQTVRRESGQRPASRRPPPSLRGLRANA